MRHIGTWHMTEQMKNPDGMGQGRGCSAAQSFRKTFEELRGRFSFLQEHQKKLDDFRCRQKLRECSGSGACRMPARSRDDVATFPFPQFPLSPLKGEEDPAEPAS